MDVTKWIGSWDFSTKEKNGMRRINVKINFGFVPSMIFLALIVFGLYQLVK